MVKICKNCNHQKSLHKYKGYVKEQCICEGYYNEPPCDCTQFEELWRNRMDPAISKELKRIDLSYGIFVPEFELEFRRDLKRIEVEKKWMK